MAGQADDKLRWRLADEESDTSQGAFFNSDDLVEHHVGTGEFRGMEFLHVNARRIINEVPASSRMPFRYTINAYRGCSHACSYCLAGETPVLMGDGRIRAIKDLVVGDVIYGTERLGSYLRYVKTEVLAHWSSVKPAFRITLQDGTELIASGDHRFLTDRGWKHVTGAGQGRLCRPHLTLNNKLIGTGGFSEPPKHSFDYRQGYLCGLIRGDGNLATYRYVRAGRAHGDVHRFRLALTDFEPLRRAQAYLLELGVSTQWFVFQQATETRRMLHAIRTSKLTAVEAIQALVIWPTQPSAEWSKGFLAGIFDAEGSYSRGILRIANTDPAIIEMILAGMERFGFDGVLEEAGGRASTVRLRGGLREHLRFFHLTDPVILRKRTIEGTALKSDAALGVVSIEPLGVEIPMYDITTGTGDFIANGVVSHNCFARPTHEYLGLNIGEDFDRRIVVKVNAVERLRAEVAARRWAGHHIAMGTNTDPYQRCEGKYHLTQGVIKVLSEATNPFSILTKSTLILRDLDLLATAAERTSVRANLSIGTLDEDVWRLTEPGTPHPRRRVDAVRRLNEAGVPCGVLIGPVIPGMSDRPDQLKEVIDACAQAGAVTISAVSLHLRPGVREHYLSWLQTARPDLVAYYKERYGTRSYLPKAEQHALSTLVRDLVGQARARFSSPRQMRQMRQIGQENFPVLSGDDDPPAAEPGQQLGFHL